MNCLASHSKMLRRRRPTAAIQLPATRTAMRPHGTRIAVDYASARARGEACWGWHVETRCPASIHREASGRDARGAEEAVHARHPQERPADLLRLVERAAVAEHEDVVADAPARRSFHSSPVFSWPLPLVSDRCRYAAAASSGPYRASPNKSVRSSGTRPAPLIGGAAAHVSRAVSDGPGRPAVRFRPDGCLFTGQRRSAGETSPFSLLRKAPFLGRIAFPFFRESQEARG